MTADADDDPPAEWERTRADLREVPGCKWAFHVVRVLSVEPLGVNEVERRIDGITATMLSYRLGQLETEGILGKSIEFTSPPSSTYRLTKTGEERARPLRATETLNPGRTWSLTRLSGRL